MKIDAHQHFWNYNAERYAWIDDSMQTIQKDFLPNDLEPILKANRIDGCVVVQVDQTEAETQFLLKLAEENSFIKGVVGWIDLRAENIEERLVHFSKNPFFKGVRHIVQGEAVDFMLGKAFQNGISKLEQFNLTYDILVYPTQLKAAIELVNKFPNQKFVIDHIAKPYIKDGKIDGWKAEMIELSKVSNVYCKVSGMVTEAHWNDWKASDFIPYLDVVFNAFGVDRILYGSDWPVCLLAAEYQEQLKITENYISQFLSDDQARIMGANAIKFYNL